MCSMIAAVQKCSFGATPRHGYWAMMFTTFGCLCDIGAVPGAYRYTADLLTLASWHATGSWPDVDGWSHIQCPMQVDEWAQCLSGHPDQAYVSYLLQGLREGFRIGYHYGSSTCRSASTNMQSATVRPEVISSFLEVELRAGRVLGPVEHELARVMQVNRFGLVPKGHQSGKWRLIVDLSSPRGFSMNGGIEPSLCSLHYTSVDEACERIVAKGRGAMLAKFDVEGAFRTVPVHPDDRWLLGMQWEGQVYIDKVLLFGLRSAPKLYNAVADAQLWILKRSDGVEAIHYLDDFLLFGAPESQQCEQALARALAHCQVLGVPIAARKTERPSSVITFLGIELDTVFMTLQLPTPKLVQLRQGILRWEKLKSCTKR